MADWLAARDLDRDALAELAANHAAHEARSRRVRDFLFLPVQCVPGSLCNVCKGGALLCEVPRLCLVGATGFHAMSNGLERGLGRRGSDILFSVLGRVSQWVG
jgi:hypothetical protein